MARWPASAPISPYLITNRGVWSYASAREHVDFWEELVSSVPACLYHVLLRPSPALLADVEVVRTTSAFAAERAAGRLVLGMHFRAGDAAMSGEVQARGSGGGDGGSELQPDVLDRLAAALGVARAHGHDNSTLFVATDTLAVRALIAAAIPRALFTSAPPRHVDLEAGDKREALRSTLVDWWLLASVDAQLGSMQSGFARTALLASATGVYHSDGGCEPCCGEDRRRFCHAGIGLAARSSHSSGVR